MKIRAFTTQALSLFIILMATSTLFAQKSLKGYPEGTERFTGVFAGMEDGHLVMKQMGEKYIVELKPATPLIGKFRPAQPFINQDKGVVNFTVICASPHPQIRKVSKQSIGFRKLGPSCFEDGGYRHHKWIKGWKPQDLESFGDALEVIGTKGKGNTIQPIKVFFEPWMDAFKLFDKSLPNLMNIGDSISIGYGAELRRQSKGKFNVEHPRLNCAGIHINPAWFGAFDEPGRQWDIVAFNGGHWNSNLPKEEYMEIFEESLIKSIKAGKKVIWITTAPVPFGYNVTDKGTTNGADASLPESQWRSIQFAHPDIQKERCGRKAGRMMAQNHWVKPILDKYPQVAVCDQWGMVYAQSKIKDSPFAKWMHGKNVHFKSTEMNGELAGMIVDLSQVLLGKKKMEEVPQRYRGFIHVSPKTYNSPADFDKPTPMDQRYKASETKSNTADHDQKWWTKPEFRLDASVVNYDKAKGRTAKQKAASRVKLAEKDLKQHQKWLKEGEVPAAQVEKAKRILEHAKKTAADAQKGEKK